MTDYRKSPTVRPWARDLFAGDLLSTAQARAICQRRLWDFGLVLWQGVNGGTVTIARPTDYQRRTASYHTQITEG